MYKRSVTPGPFEIDAFANPGQAVDPVSGMHLSPIVAGAMSVFGRGGEFKM